MCIQGTKSASCRAALCCAVPRRTVMCRSCVVCPPLAVQSGLRPARRRGGHPAAAARAGVGHDRQEATHPDRRHGREQPDQEGAAQGPGTPPTDPCPYTVRVLLLGLGRLFVAGTWPACCCLSCVLLLAECWHAGVLASWRPSVRVSGVSGPLCPSVGFLAQHEHALHLQAGLAYVDDMVHNPNPDPNYVGHAPFEEYATRGPALALACARGPVSTLSVCAAFAV